MDSDEKLNWWLTQLPSPDSKAPLIKVPLSEADGRKRRNRSDTSIGQISPPPTEPMSQIEQCDNGDLLETPRPPKRQRHRNSERPQTESQSTNSQGSSRASSSRKKLATLALQPDGISTRILDSSARDLPRPLLVMMQEFMDANTGYGVISAKQKAEVQDQHKADPTVAVIRDYCFAGAKERTELGPSPSIVPVLDIKNWALRLQEQGAEEAAWNAAVRFPLLQLAFHGGSRPSNHVVDYITCTTANVISEYKSVTPWSRKIDFCICIDPSADLDRPDAASLVDNCRASRPLNSISHSDYHPLLTRPITAGIECKSYGGDLAKADLQIGVWQAAQWRNLRELVGGDSGKLAKLPFLPAVIVHGHDWLFVATTRSGTSGKTILWKDVPFGSTRDALGIYKIVYGLQLLRRWSQDIFWPWFYDNVLQTHSDAG